jgi:RPA family protein
MKREQAWRVFSGEFNDSTVEIEGTGEKSPSYIITPLGCKINRLYSIGVLTDVESVSENEEMIRAHLSDPTGVFTLYAGRQYQPEATDQLLRIEVPAFVAVVGKARSYVPEEGTLYVSIRPETVMEVNAETRDRWIVETCKHTKQRIEAMLEAMKMNQPNAYDLRKIGYSKDLSEGIITAIKNYGNVDVSKYIALVKESLQYSISAKDLFTPAEKKEKTKEIETIEIPKEKKIETTKTDSDDSEDIEQIVLEIIKDIEGEEGASWDSIVEKCKDKKLDENTIEEALSSLMDKGFIFEPVLGTIKTT